MTGDVVVDYYPAVVDADLHRRALAAMAERSRKFTGRGRRLVNLFSGLAVCGNCGNKMTFRGKGRKQRADGTWVNEDYLVCDGYQRGKGCANNVHYNYATWEDGILDPIIFEAFSDDRPVSQSEVRDLEIEIARLERAWHIAKSRADNALRIAVETGRPEAQVIWTDLATECDAANDALDDARSRLLISAHTPSLEEQWSRLERLRSDLKHEDETVRFEARTKVQSAIHALVSRLAFFGPYPLGVEVEVAKERLISIHYDELNGGTEWSMHDLDADNRD